jgi:hypothetical protein
MRWRVERDYEDLLKQEIGLGHYEGRGWRGFHHHGTLAIAAYGFLISEREGIPPSGPHSGACRRTDPRHATQDQPGRGRNYKDPAIIHRPCHPGRICQRDVTGSPEDRLSPAGLGRHAGPRAAVLMVFRVSADAEATRLVRSAVSEASRRRGALTPACPLLTAFTRETRVGPYLAAPHLGSAFWGAPATRSTAADCSSTRFEPAAKKDDAAQQRDRAFGADQLTAP